MEMSVARDRGVMKARLTQLCGAVTALLLLASQGRADVKYGMICTQSSQPTPSKPDGWLGPYADLWAGCTEFHQALDPSGTRRFYWDSRHGEHHGFEEDSPWESDIESTDLALIVGHGGAWSRMGADIAGYRISDEVFSKKMRLGDEGLGLSIFAIFACSTLAPYAADAGQRPGPEDWWGNAVRFYHAEEDIAARWWKAMQGGLRIIVGSWDVMYTDCGRASVRNFGRNLAAGTGVWEAWRKASMDACSNQNPAVVASGTSRSNCLSRLNGIKLTNFNSYARLCDDPQRCSAQMTDMCWTVDF